ncbi:hypothetical protein, partial [Klebsiella pneumoniae]|uniref:hypothetical protein n=1 Tax=Klebsiella pneumoniae TaxID=573 RepID=UPI003C70767A
GTVQDITETRLAEAAREDLLLQNTLQQAMATAANEAETFDEVLLTARELVLAHEDWVRARAFVPGPDGRM